MRSHAQRPLTTALTAFMLVVGLVFTAGCTINSSSGMETKPAKRELSPEEKAREEILKVGLTSSVEDGATGVSVATPVTLSAKKPLDNAQIINPEGKIVEGTFSPDRMTWTSKEKLGFGTSYKFQASSGPANLEGSFTTFGAKKFSSTSLSPLDKSTVGVGQSVAIFFDKPVANKKAVQDAITVETNNGTEGAFYWISSQSLRWRPKEFWRPGTQVSVKAELYGVDHGNGVYGNQDRYASFTIGDDVRGEVDDATKTLTITKNGQVIKTMPVSNGRNVPQWATPNGTYVVGDQHKNMIMDSTTYGYSLSAGGYRTPVNYATQLSWSGIYIHGAPWSVGAQGYQNTSHGCVNVSDANAKWVMDNMKRGDVVVIKNTVGKQLDGHDGLGDWQIPWSTWSKGNAHV